MKDLSTTNIDLILENNEKFKGAFPCDQIPQFSDNEYQLIINTDNSSLPGTHWTGVVVRGSDVYFFDSFGRYYENLSFPSDFRTSIQKLCVGKNIKFQKKRFTKFSK